jgi:hypothetical protein
VDNLRKLVEDLNDVPERLAVLESQVGDLRAGGKEWARRLWMIIGPLIAGVLGAGIVYYFGWKKYCLNPKAANRAGTPSFLAVAGYATRPRQP